MLRRLAAFSHQAPNEERPMSPSPGEEQPPQEPRTVSGLAGVFKGLAGGGKTSKPLPPIPQVPPVVGSTALGKQPDALSQAVSSLQGLSPEQADLVAQLKNGHLSERVTAANKLRFAVVDFPLNPVSY